MIKLHFFARPKWESHSFFRKSSSSSFVSILFCRSQLSLNWCSFYASICKDAWTMTTWKTRRWQNSNKSFGTSPSKSTSKRMQSTQASISSLSIYSFFGWTNKKPNRRHSVLFALVDISVFFFRRLPRRTLTDGRPISMKMLRS